MTVDILNSSGKKTGECNISATEIEIKNGVKPILVISDPQVLDGIKKKDFSEIFLLYLYDNYLLMISEIAALYQVTYSNINKRIKHLTPSTKKKEGRRNASYGTKFGPSRLYNMSEAAKKSYIGRDHPNLGQSMSMEQRALISATLKKKYATGELVQDPEKKRMAWKRGAYDYVDFKRGIGGFLFSNKMNSRFVFRSLLELAYFLELETNDKIFDFKYEPLRIPCDNGSVYTPDFLINNQLIVELKSRKYVKSSPEILEKFNYKKEQAEKFCSSHGLLYQVIFDDELNFDSRRMKRHLANHPELIKQYQIEFFDPSRISH